MSSATPAARLNHLIRQAGNRTMIMATEQDNVRQLSSRNNRQAARVFHLIAR